MSARIARGFPAVVLLFFAWGFIGANNDPLLVALKGLYALSFVEALLTHFMFAMAFFTLSLPAAMLCSRIGFPRAILIALVLMAAGCAAVGKLAGAAPYAVVLGALFLTASGFVLLQVAANPLAAELGPADNSHWRLNLAQSLNSLGMVVGANAGAVLMLSDPARHAGTVGSAYLLYSAMIIGVGLAFVLSARGLPASVGRNESVPVKAVFRSPWAWFGAAAIGIYVGAEVTLSSLMVSFLNQPATFGATLEQGGQWLANIYWGGALVGRLAGIVLLGRMKAARLLAGCASVAAALCLTAALAGGPLAGAAALAVGLVNSVMFPTIFSITLEKVRLPAAATSGLLCVAIAGGSLLPLGAARIADLHGIANALILPVMAYLFILLFAVRAGRAT